MESSGTVNDTYGPIDVIFDGDDIFLRSADTHDLRIYIEGAVPLAGPDDWVKLADAQAASMSSSTSYASFVDLVGIGDVTDAGRDGVGHKYVFDMTVEDMLDSDVQLTMDESTLDGLADEDRKDLLGKPVSYTIWVDDQDRIVQLEMGMTMDVPGMNMDIQVHSTSSDFGVPVDAQPPTEYVTY